MSGPRVLVAVLLVVLAAACSSPAPEPEAPPPQAALEERFGAPVVEDPRDVSAFAFRPCEALSEEELDGLGFPEPGEQRTSIDVPQCVWQNDDVRLSFTFDADRDLLVDVYRADLLPIFTPSEVEGLPTVWQRSDTDDSTCFVTTGLGPRQALSVEWSASIVREVDDPCERAEEAIALAVRKLPPQ